jgi:AcrR family transcriptional regulator
MVSVRDKLKTSADSRRELVLTTAAALFRQRGFNGAGIDDIGAAVGLTGPSIFHYFPSKQAILTEIADTFVSALEDAATNAGKDASGEELVDRLVNVVLASPDSLAVCLRHLSYLDADTRVSLENRLWSLACTLAQSGTQKNRVHLRTRAAAGALISLALSRSSPRVGLQPLATDMTMRILNTPLPHRSPVNVQAPREDLRRRASRAFRSEAILAEAARLFRERGFNGVSLSDIGAAVGITGSAVNRRFGSKEKLLAAAFDRLADQVGSLVYEALANAASAAEAVEDVISSYIEGAVLRRDLICLNLSETYRLPEGDRLNRRKRQRAYTDELVHVLKEIHPGLTEAEAEARARVAFVVVSEVVNSDELAKREGLIEDLTTLALAVLEPAPPNSMTPVRVGTSGSRKIGNC